MKASTFETVKDRLPATVGVGLEGATVADIDVLVTPVVRSSDLALVLPCVVESVVALVVLVSEEVDAVLLDAVESSPLALEMLLAAEFGLDIVLDVGLDVVLDMFDKS